MSARSLVLSFLVGLLIFATVAGLVGCKAKQSVEFVEEEQPILEKLIENQYFQLRRLSVVLDQLACKIKWNERAYADLKKLYGTNEANWQLLPRMEAEYLRLERAPLLQRYTNVAAQYNALRTKVCTAAGNLGLDIDVAEAPESYSPDANMCNDFTLPKEIPVKRP